MKKVLHVIDSLSLGGAETLVKGIIEKNIPNLFLFVLRKTARGITINSSDCYIYPSFSKYSLMSFFCLKKYLRQNKIEILHCHLPKSLFFGFIIKKFFLRNLKLIFHEHGEIVSLEKVNKLARFFYVNFLKRTRKYVDIYLAISNYVEQSLVNFAKIDSKQIKVLKNFVDLKRFNPSRIIWDKQEEKEKIGLIKKSFIVGFAGRIIPRKGWEDFIQAAILLKNEPFLQFLIAGNGKDREKMLGLIKSQDLTKKVFFLGFCSQMVRFYSRLDCLVVPSNFEPFGLTLIEAQSLGLPVICANVPALNETVQDQYNGLLYEVNNPLELVRKIKLLKEDQQLREKIIRNASLTVKEYDLDSYLSSLREIYQII